MKTCKIKSYAKINLFLEVLNKRKDNYHQIVTLFERISLSDEITIKSRRDKKTIRIICNHPDVPKGRKNLVYRTASLLKRDLGINKGLDIKIDKCIPPASGLGGGSSNAASVLLGLNRLWKLGLSKEKMLFYGKGLGSDVPFFLFNASFAIGEERGDNIKVITTVKRKLWHVLVVPKIRVSTRLIYARLDRFFRKRIRKPMSIDRQGAGSEHLIELTKSLNDVRILIQALKEGEIPLIKKSLFNRLQMVAFSFYPELKRLKNIMLDFGIEAISMSGSGPAMFGIVSSRKEAIALSKQLSKFRGWDIFITRTL